MDRREFERFRVFSSLHHRFLTAQCATDCIKKMDKLAHYNLKCTLISKNERVTDGATIFEA